MEHLSGASECLTKTPPLHSCRRSNADLQLENELFERHLNRLKLASQLELENFGVDSHRVMGVVKCCLGVNLNVVQIRLVKGLQQGQLGGTAEAPPIFMKLYKICLQINFI